MWSCKCLARYEGVFYRNPEALTACLTLLQVTYDVSKRLDAVRGAVAALQLYVSTPTCKIEVDLEQKARPAQTHAAIGTDSAPLPVQVKWNYVYVATQCVRAGMAASYRIIKQIALDIKTPAKGKGAKEGKEALSPAAAGAGGTGGSGAPAADDSEMNKIRTRQMEAERRPVLGDIRDCEQMIFVFSLVKDEMAEDAKKKPAFSALGDDFSIEVSERACASAVN